MTRLHHKRPCGDASWTDTRTSSTNCREGWDKRDDRGLRPRLHTTRTPTERLTRTMRPPCISRNLRRRPPATTTKCDSSTATAKSTRCRLCHQTTTTTATTKKNQQNPTDLHSVYLLYGDLFRRQHNRRRQIAHPSTTRQDRRRHSRAEAGAYSCTQDTAFREVRGKDHARTTSHATQIVMPSCVLTPRRRGDDATTVKRARCARASPYPACQC